MFAASKNYFFASCCYQYCRYLKTTAFPVYKELHI